ncbi:MAG: zinc-dependent alcohol dehydrogenase family protein [Sulfobacillus thermotolerans]|nr:zinc-dependent alcohol dehydrogenase family protein [Sulfobacillus thermotolerans]
MDTMKAVVLHAPKEASVELMERPDAGTNEVIVKVGACGLCGTDLKIFSGDYLSPYPLVPGHEMAGTIVSVGSGVDSKKIGLRVGVDPTLACGKCEFCQAAQFNHCENWGAIGDTVNGGFAEFVKVPVANTYPLPDELPVGLGALIEPVACAEWAIERMTIRPGSRALIFGAGPMGIILMVMLLRSGVIDVTVVDLSGERLTAAKSFGAHHTVLSSDLSDLRATEPKGFELVVDATGHPNVFSQAVSWVRKSGQLLLFGVSPVGATASVEPYLIYHNEITILSSMAINHSYGAAVRLVNSYRHAFEPLITHTLPLEQYVDAIQMVQQGRGIKIQLAI